CKLLAVASLIFWQWQQPSMEVGTYTASGNSILAVGMPCAFYSQHSGYYNHGPYSKKLPILLSAAGIQGYYCLQQKLMLPSSRVTAADGVSTVGWIKTEMA
nr:hypothetical protein [Tanacetum cinerariifolium]